MPSVLDNTDRAQVVEGNSICKHKAWEEETSDIWTSNSIPTAFVPNKNTNNSQH